MPPGGPAATEDFTPKKAVEMLSMEDLNSKTFGPRLLALRERVKHVDYAEEFLELDGLNELLKVAARKDISYALQGMCLKAIVELLVLENALDQVAGSQELVDRIYSILTVPGVLLSASKPSLDILVYLCGYVEKGYRMVLDAAEAKHGVGMKPYSCLIPLLASEDISAVKSTLLLMNWLLKKVKQHEDDLALKQLLFKWKDCGLLSIIQRVSDRSLDDVDIKKGLQAFQQMSNVTIPRSWEEAAKFQAKYEEMRKRCEDQGESLFVYQQQQAKMRLMRLELAKAQETIRALNLMVPGASTNYHPSKRFADGGGIPLSTLCSDNRVDLDYDAVAKEIAAARKAIFEEFVANPEFRPAAEKMFGGRPAAGSSRSRRLDPLADVDDFGPPPDDDGPPPDDDFGPPPEDDLGPPPDDDELGPPPDDDDDAPPPDGAPPSHTGAKHPTPKKSTAAPGASGAGHAAPYDGGAPTADGGAATASSGAASSAHASPGQVPPPTLGEKVVEGGAGPSTAPAQAGTVPPAPQVASPTTGGPPAGAPPPPPPKFGAPPPPPKFGIGAGAAAKKVDERQFFTGKPPSKKMKPFHWEKQPLPAEPGSIWHRIHENKEFNLAFDYEEFESMYSQKEMVVEEKKEVKKKRTPLLDGQLFQNLSIMLHKLPTIPNIQRAIMELDDETLSRDSLVAIVAQCPNADVVKQFQAKAGTVPEAEYEPPEQFVALTQTLPAFKQRCTSWLFTMEFEDNVTAILKPISRLTEAINAVVASKHLPYILGLLLGFGNLMNYGDAKKGNAPAIPLSTLSKLDATKDNRGKTSLMQHLFNCMKKENPDSLELHEELKPIMNNVTNIKFEDLEKGVTDCEKNLKLFVSQVNMVKKAMEKIGINESEDVYVPRMTEFSLRAEARLKEAMESFATCKESFNKLLTYFGVKGMKPEDFFAELVPFVERVRKESIEAAKDKKRAQKKGKKIGNELGEALGKLQETMVLE